MKAWLLLVAVAACSSTPADPHVVVACQGYLTQTGQPFSGNCEVACAKASANGGAPTGTGGSCMALHGSGDFPQTLSCNATLSYDGTAGCCAPGTDGVADIEFFACR
jgi:hypothetical protein